MEDKILKGIYDSLQIGKKVALAVITEIKGSTPRKKGALMSISEDGKILGSIGGGNLEYDVIERAKECIKKENDEDFQFELNDDGDLHMHCGGEARVYIKVFKPRPKLLIVGAGHIGVELFKLAKILDFNSVIFDDRDEFANKTRFVDADEIIVGDIGKKIANYRITEDTYIVIITRGHKCDTDALREVVNTKAAYIGMIGSKKKTEHVIKNLIVEGIQQETLQKVYAPIGLDISSGEPNEIAFAIMSEILLVKNSGSLKHMKDIPRVNSIRR